MENKQDLIEEIKRGEISSEIPNEDLSSDSKKREAKFNKRVYVANKLRQLGAAVAMTASTIGGANAQENNSAEGLPRDVNANTIELPINKEATESHLSEMKDYSYYEYLHDNYEYLHDKGGEEYIEHSQQIEKSIDLKRKLEKGEMGYTEAKAAAKHICAHLTIDPYMRARNYKAEDLENSIWRSKTGSRIVGHPELTHGKDYEILNTGTYIEVIPLTEEYAARQKVLENKAVISAYLTTEGDVTRGLLKCISSDSTLTDEAKDSLMRKEISDYFSAIDSGRYDAMIEGFSIYGTEVNEDLFIRNRTNWKKGILRDLSEINPSLAEELCTQYSMPVKTIKNQTVPQRNDFER